MRNPCEDFAQGKDGKTETIAVNVIVKSECDIEDTTYIRRNGLFPITGNLRHHKQIFQDKLQSIEKDSYGDTSPSDPLPHRPAVGNKTPRRRDNRHERNSNSSAGTPAPSDFSPHYTNNNNNNHVKNERLSPGTSETTSRSRSATPGSASHPGTPPSTTAAMGVDGVLGRNYSDFMRSLAAKYNNTNPNDFFSAARNGGFPPPLDSRFKPAVSASTPTFAGLLPLPLPNNNKDPPPGTAKDAPPNMTGAAKPPPDFAAAASMLSPFAGPAMFPPLIDMTSTQTLIALARTAKEAEIQNLLKNVKRPDPSSPLDLSSAGGPPAPKRSRTTKTPSLASSGSPNSRCASALPKRACSESPRICEDIATWTVDDVCNFIAGIDICAEYVQTFREQCIDGAGLPLLTEEHLTTKMSMKLGPALKLRSILARKLGNCSLCLHCSHCHAANSANASPSPERHNHSSDSGGAS